MFKNALALLLGLLISLLIFEGFLRIFNPFPFRVKGTRIYLQTNRKILIPNDRFKGEPSTIIHTKNSLGFRGPEKPKDFSQYLSIIAVGGSTTECYYLPDNETWPYQLGEKLNGSLSNVWVNNAGLDGNSTFGHIVLLEDFLIKIKPKIALFLVGINDVARDDMNDFDKERNLSNSNGLKSVLRHSEIVYLAANIARVFHASRSKISHGIIDFAKARYFTVTDSDIKAETERHRLKYIPAYKERLIKIISLCRANNIEPVIISQPSLIGKGFDDITGANLETIEYDKNINGRMQWEILQQYNAAAADVCREKGVFFISLADKMPKSSNYFYDNYHFSGKGAVKVAEIIASELSPYLSDKYKIFLKGGKL